MLPEHMMMFATGIECSYPVILDGTHRVDELALTGHYERWREDLALVREMGLKFLRYGFPYHLVNPSRGIYNWEFCDAVMNEMQALGIIPILDVCHFGLPDWLGNSFQNQDFPREFAKYARAVVGSATRALIFRMEGAGTATQFWKVVSASPILPGQIRPENLFWKCYSA